MATRTSFPLPPLPCDVSSWYSLVLGALGVTGNRTQVEQQANKNTLSAPAWLVITMRSLVYWTWGVNAGLSVPWCSPLSDPTVERHRHPRHAGMS